MKGFFSRGRKGGLADAIKTATVNYCLNPPAPDTLEKLRADFEEMKRETGLLRAVDQRIYPLAPYWRTEYWVNAGNVLEIVNEKLDLIAEYLGAEFIQECAAPARRILRKKAVKK